MQSRFDSRISSPPPARPIAKSIHDSGLAAVILKDRGAAAAVLLALLLFAAPLPFGGVEAGWSTLLRVGVCGVLVLAVALAPRATSALKTVALPALALAAVALVGVVQSLPWPAGWAEALSPEHVRLAAQADDLLRLGAGGEPAAGEAVAATRPGVPLSLAPSMSRAAALGWLALAACLAAAALVGRERSRRRWLGGALLAAAGFEVLYGARRWLSGTTTIWDVETPLGAERLRGTFVNPNHFAAYLELALPVVFAAGWWCWRRARHEPSFERRLLLAAPPVVVWVALFASLAFSGSRAGLVAAVAGVGVQGVLLAASRRRLGLAPVGLVAAAIGLGVVGVAGLHQGLGRLVTTSAYEVTLGARAEAYRAALQLWALFPWTGTGLGTFVEGFPLVQPADLPLTWYNAHNDPLELLVTGGVAAAAIAVVGLAALLVRLGRVLVGGSRSEDRAAALAALGALTSLGIHECFDFGLTIPANGFTLAALCGAAAAARRAAPVSPKPPEPARSGRSSPAVRGLPPGS